MKIDFDFIPQGAQVNVEDDHFIFVFNDGTVKKWERINSVIVDTGNRLEPGIIDHHQPGSEDSCVASIIANDYEKYLSHLTGQEPVTLITHFVPDLDAIASCFFLKKILEGGQLTDADKLLSQYVNDVDGGKLTMDPDYPLSIASVINAIVEKTQERAVERRSMGIVEKALPFLDQVIKLLELKPNPWAHDFLDQMEGIDEYIELIEKDAKTYEEDLRLRSTTDQLTLLNVDTNLFEEVDFLETRNPESFLWKYWARGDIKNSANGEGFMATCAFRDNNPGVDKHRAIIATDPNTPYDLKGLGILIDSLEIQKLADLGREKSDLASDPRKGFHRNDPWYDGRSPMHDYTIIDAPREGSELNQHEILEAIKATELWFGIGEKIEEYKDFDKVAGLLPPLTFEELEIDALDTLMDTGVEQFKFQFDTFRKFSEDLHRLSPANIHQRKQRECLRNLMFEKLTELHDFLTLPERVEWAPNFVDLIKDFFPTGYMQDWMTSVENLPEKTFVIGLQHALRHSAPKRRMLYLAAVQAMHPKTLQQLLARDGKDTFSEFNQDNGFDVHGVFDLFHVPEIHLNAYEEHPLFLFESAGKYICDLLVCIALKDHGAIDEKLKKFHDYLQDMATNPLSGDEIEAFDSLSEELIQDRIVVSLFGEQFLRLREQRSELLKNPGAIKGIEGRIKRNDVNRLVSKSFGQLSELLFELEERIANLPSVETADQRQDKPLSEYLHSLRLLLKIRQYEFLWERMKVYLKLRSSFLNENAGKQSPLQVASPEIRKLLEFLVENWQTSIAFIQNGQREVLLRKLNKAVMDLNHLKSMDTDVPGFRELTEELFRSFTRFVEDQELSVSEANKSLETCFRQFESLRQDGPLLKAVNALPGYFRHVLHEMLLTHKRYYREKISFLQGELNYVVEVDGSSPEQTGLYVEFCNEILLKTMVQDWKKLDTDIMNCNDSELIRDYFARQYHWQQMVNGDFKEKSKEERKEVNKLNSTIRFAEGNSKEDIGTLVKKLPADESCRDRLRFENYLNFLVREREINFGAIYVPLHLYIDVYDHLTEAYIEKFDIDNVSDSISSFSLKYPAYLRWFTNTAFIRNVVLGFIALLFMMGFFDPNVYLFDGQAYRPPVPERAMDFLGPGLFSVFSNALTVFWTIFIGVAFLFPVAFVLYKLIVSSYFRLTDGKHQRHSILSTIQRVEGKKSKLLYLGFIIPLLLVVIQMAKPGTIDMISHFRGFRLLSTIIIIFMLTLYSIYIDVQRRNPHKSQQWLLGRANHMFWLYSLQALVITVFVIDFLLRFQLNVHAFESPEDLVNVGISRYIMLSFGWFDIVIMPLFTVIIAFLTLFFSFFINRIFRR